ncbi:MAG: divalent cation transporter [Bdellovibrionaceae bacterium]|nr:divalent cation transporter [Pseudobdellovibrionaceae bacterium]|tara:strand:+ start:3101 stop:3823 length:723 start_codon:yes stop_codon:yes gene_type:complete
MSDWIQIVVYTWLAGLTMGLGGSLATIERIQPQWLEKEFRHGVIAFGGVALFSAVSLVLVPKGIENLTMAGATLSFLSGAFFFADLSWIANHSGWSILNLIAMLADYVPEAIALGATLSTESQTGYILAFLIGLQNFPEGFNAYREQIHSKRAKAWQVLTVLFALSLLGPLAGILGYSFLTGHPKVLGMIMLFASSGILYLVFRDLAPQAKLKNTWLPPMGAILGFLLGLMGHLFLLQWK